MKKLILTAISLSMGFTLAGQTLADNPPPCPSLATATLSAPIPWESGLYFKISNLGPNFKWGVIYVYRYDPEKALAIAQSAMKTATPSGYGTLLTNTTVYMCSNTWPFNNYPTPDHIQVINVFSSFDILPPPH